MFASPQNIASIFPDSALIELLEQSFDEEGTEIRSYTTLVDGVPAQLSAVPGISDVRTLEGSFEDRSRRVILYGWYPEVDETSLITIDGHVYHVRGIDPDSYGVANASTGWTPLLVEERDDQEDGS